MKKILITGGAGFIGSHTAVALYEHGFWPVIVDNFSNSERDVLAGLKNICQTEFPCYEGDCLDAAFMRETFKAEGPLSGVIHFAAFKSVNESQEKPLLYYRNNIGSLLALLDVMRETKTPALVFSSSCTVYGQPDVIPVSEKAPMKETPSAYGKTKQICEDILKDTISRNLNIKAVALRYFNPIGAHPSGEIGELPIGTPNNLVPYVTQTAAGIREALTIFGNDYHTPDGTCIRDYIHVMDLAAAHVCALEYLDKIQTPSFYDIFNVGTGRGHSVLEVVETFKRVTGKPLNYVFGGRRDGDVETVYADPRRANQDMGWRAELSLDTALKDAWNWQTCLGQKAAGAR